MGQKRDGEEGGFLDDDTFLDERSIAFVERVEVVLESVEPQRSHPEPPVGVETAAAE